MAKLLYWIAGADKDALSHCSFHEKNKIGGVGSLILIPSLLGFVSMSYAISTVINELWLVYPLAFLWSCIVLIIDRHLVSISYNISSKNTNKPINMIEKIEFYSKMFGKVFLRFVFAIGIGITVSHPLVLRIFDSTINETMQNQKGQEIKTSQKYETQQKEPLLNEIKEKEAKKQCYQKLLTLEQSGVKGTTDCGASSGLPNCGRRCDKIQEIINDLDREIREDKSILRLQIRQIENAGEIERINIEKSFSTDYLKRVLVLDDLEKKFPHIQVVSLFLIVFFVFIDVMPLLMKLITDNKEYEDIIGLEIKKQTLQNEALQEAYDEVTKKHEKEIQIMFQNYENTKANIDNIVGLPINLLEKIDKIWSEFGEKRGKFMKRINKLPTDEEKNNASNYLTEINHIFWKSISNAIEKVKATMYHDENI